MIDGTPGEIQCTRPIARPTRRLKRLAVNSCGILL